MDVTRGGEDSGRYRWRSRRRTMRTEACTATRPRSRPVVITSGSETQQAAAVVRSGRIRIERHRCGHDPRLPCDNVGRGEAPEACLDSGSGGKAPQATGLAGSAETLTQPLAPVGFAPHRHRRRPLPRPNRCPRPPRLTAGHSLLGDTQRADARTVGKKPTASWLGAQRATTVKSLGLSSRLTRRI